MQGNITIGRLEREDVAACIQPEDESWQLIVDKEGIPHLYVRVKVTDVDSDQLFAVEDMLIENLTIKDIMLGEFLHMPDLTDEEIATMQEESAKEQAERGVPYPVMHSIARRRPSGKKT